MLRNYFILALGWVPQTSYPRANVVPTLRATYESGALVPIDARYTPDWKGDWETQMESHAMTRTDSSDKLLSFINRAHATNDVPVAIDLDSLGFGGGRIFRVVRSSFPTARRRRTGVASAGTMA